MIRSSTGGSHCAVPGALGIDDGDRTAFADAKAVRLGAQDAALLGQPELLEAPLQKVPRREAAILVAAFRLRLIAAEKDVPPRDRHADALRRSRAAIRHAISFSRARAITHQTPNSSGIPCQPELVRRRHVADERRGGDDGRAGEIAFAAEAHAVLPVAVERRDRALPFLERVRPLAEARPAPRLADLAADRSEHLARSIRRRAADRAARSGGRRRPSPGRRRTRSRSSTRPARARRGRPAPPRADRRSCRWCTTRSSPCRTSAARARLPRRETRCPG